MQQCYFPTTPAIQRELHLLTLFPPMVYSKNRVQEIMTQAIMKQGEETKKELRAYVEQQHIENNQYKLSMQQAISSQFTPIYLRCFSKIFKWLKIIETLLFLKVQQWLAKVVSSGEVGLAAAKNEVQQNYWQVVEIQWFTCPAVAGCVSKISY